MEGSSLLRQEAVCEGVLRLCEVPGLQVCRQLKWENNGSVSLQLQLGSWAETRSAHVSVVRQRGRKGNLSRREKQRNPPG